MNKRISQTVAIAATTVMLSLFSCSTEEIEVQKQQEEENPGWVDPYADYPKLDGVSLSGVDTKVSYDGLDTDQTHFKSHFDQGDQIYILAVEASAETAQPVGQYAYTYTGEGKKWEPVDSNKKAPWSETMQYFAYWNGTDIDLTTCAINVTGKADKRAIPETWKTQEDNTLTAANTFFHDAIVWWTTGGSTTTPRIDLPVLNVKTQNTIDNFRKQDLMTGKGINSGKMSATFTLYHAMGLACIQHVDDASVEVVTVKELSTDEHYCWKESTTYSKILTHTDADAACKPYYNQGEEWEYLWVSPKEVKTQTLITPDLNWSRELRIGTAKFARIKLDKSIIFPRQQYVLAEGDILYNDGTLTHNGDIKNNIAGASRTPIGIVVSIDGNSIDDSALATIKTSQTKYTISKESADGTEYEINNRGNNGSDGAGFHGLVLALEDAASAKTKWSNSSFQTNNTYSGGTYNVDGVSNANTWALVKADNKGYSNTMAIYNLVDEYNRNLNTYFPAFGTVKSFGVDISKLTSTEWFLPSAGQWIALSQGLLKTRSESLYRSNVSDVPKDLEELEEWTTETISSGSSTYKMEKISENETIADGKWVIYDIPDTYLLQHYLANAGSKSDISPAEGGVVYWSSTEGNIDSDNKSPRAIHFCPGGGTMKELTLGWDSIKNEPSNTTRVRPMLAF